MKTIDQRIEEGELVEYGSARCFYDPLDAVLECEEQRSLPLQWVIPPTVVACAFVDTHGNLSLFDDDGRPAWAWHGVAKS